MQKQALFFRLCFLGFAVGVFGAGRLALCRGLAAACWSRLLTSGMGCLHHGSLAAMPLSFFAWSLFMARDGWRCAGAWLLRAGQTAYERHELPAPWLTCRDAAVFFRLIAVHGLGRPKRDAQKHALASADSNRRGD
ncbi:hypothetical protein QYF48_00150 [Brevibacillus agri]|uniref:hypothetical protein n=1 Tax=Brevibacillus agri TaxID=51101 RepID=UPI0025B6FFE6|nr:hypothetical protein [Brevibacillus agri]MDN4091233.1 hypothetical protein [Brevibacillus agri]